MYVEISFVLPDGSIAMLIIIPDFGGVFIKNSLYKNTALTF